MPFEAGLAVALAHGRPAHQWFVFEARRFRIQRTLSDLGGTDAYIHGDSSRTVLAALSDALVRAQRQPTIDLLYRGYRFLVDESIAIRRSHGTLFGARAFKNLVFLANDFVRRPVA
jgi:hypothetical protein